MANKFDNMFTKFLNSLYSGEERHKDFLRKEFVRVVPQH
jgi:hypothetical protein